MDTSRVFPHPAGSAKCKSLKALAKEFLNREIQQREDGHDSREDALAALDLLKMKLLKLNTRFSVDCIRFNQVFT